MKNVIFIFLLGVVVASCDTREDYFNTVNNTPEIQISQNGTILDGSITDTLKIGQIKTYNYSIVDEEAPLELYFDQINDSIVIKSKTVKIKALEEGQNTLTLKAADSFGAVGKREINLVIIKNLLPTCEYVINKVGNASPYEVEIDASKSIDTDAKLGGKVLLYEYDLHNYIIQTELSKIRYIFGTPGQKRISVRVQDNNGDWSAINTQYYLLQ